MENYVFKNGILVPNESHKMDLTSDEFDIERARNKFVFYSDFYLHLIKDKYLKLPDDIAIKQQHSLSMANLVADATSKSGFFNESYILSAFIDGLFHDFGRFSQYYLSGTLKDSDSKSYTGFDNHGEYGAYLLEKNNYQALRFFIGDVKKYYQILVEVIRNHTVTKNVKYQKQINDLIDVFPNYDLDEVINSNDDEIINQLIALKIIMVVAEDSLELIYNVRDGKWKPLISSDPSNFAHPEIIEKFFNQENINIKEFKDADKWSCNAGFLFRYGLIFKNINIRSSLQSLVDDNTIDKVFNIQTANTKDENGEIAAPDVQRDPALEFARDYANYKANKILEYSVGSKIITEDIKQAALLDSQREFGPRYVELLNKIKHR